MRLAVAPDLFGALTAGRQESGRIPLFHSCMPDSEVMDTAIFFRK
jgi:hypothetical protein